MTRVAGNIIPEQVDVLETWIAEHEAQGHRVTRGIQRTALCWACRKAARDHELPEE